MGPLAKQADGAEQATGLGGFGEGEDVGDGVVEGVDHIDCERMFAGGKGAELKAVGRTDAAAQIRAVKRDRGGLKDLAQVERGAGEVLSNGKACLVAEGACLAGEFGAGKIVQIVKLDGLAKDQVRGIGAGRGKGDVPGAVNARDRMLGIGASVLAGSGRRSLPERSHNRS